MRSPRKPRICFYGVSTQSGGAEKSLFDLVSRLGDSFEKMVVLPLHEGPLIDQFKERNVRVEVLEMPSSFLRMSRSTPLISLGCALASMWTLPRYYFRLTKLLKDERVDLIHTTGIKCHLISAMIKLNLGIPVIWHLRDMFLPGLTRSLLRFFAILAKIDLVFNSRATQYSFSEEPLVQNRVFETVYNGLSEEVYFPKTNSMIQQELGLAPDTPIVANLGVLATWKGQLDFVAMARIVAKENPDVHFLIVGDQIYDTAGDRNYPELLKKAVENADLASRLHFLGFRKEIPQLLNSVSVLVHTSRKPEPFGRVILEAMACGVPVVATRGGGVDEFVVDHETALMVTSGDIASYAKAVIESLHKSESTQNMIRKAHELFLERFTIAKHVQTMEKILDHVLELKR